MTTVGGLDLFPPDPAIPPGDYTGSLDAVGIAYEALDADEVARRWPQLRVPEGTLALLQADAAIVPAARGTAAMQRLARQHGAELRERSPVRRAAGATGPASAWSCEGTQVHCGGVVVSADAWTNEVLGAAGSAGAAEVTLEQVTYFAPTDPEPFARPAPAVDLDGRPVVLRLPLLRRATTVKAAQDCGGPLVDPEDRDRRPRTRRCRRCWPTMCAARCPESGPPVRSLRCQYTLTPDRDFVLSPVPGQPASSSGWAPRTASSSLPTFGRVLADLATRASPSPTSPRSGSTGRRSPTRLRRALAGVTSQHRLRSKPTGFRGSGPSGPSHLNHRWSGHGVVVEVRAERATRRPRSARSGR